MPDRRRQRGFGKTEEIMRFLLTGFEPFGGDDVNSSQEVVRTLSCDESGGVELVISILPVSFKRAGNAICRLIDATEPDVVIMLGQSSKSNCIKCFQRAKCD